MSLSATLILLLLALTSPPPGSVPSLEDVAGLPASLPVVATAAGKVEPGLLRQLLEKDSDKQYRVVIELASQADLTVVSPSSREVRHTEVVLSLKSVASQTQAELLSFLDARQASGHAQQVQPFWIFNGLAATVDADTLLALAARPEVAVIRQDRWRRWLDPFIEDSDRSEAGPDDVQWNLGRIRADLAWNALGLDGSGVTVAILDSGVDWLHPALLEQYRGYKPEGLTIHHGNWLCTTDEGYLYPGDGHGHGTHVAGIAVGGRDESGGGIGVAPGARWIAVKMLNDQGYAYDSWIHAAFEWILAPAGDPRLAPDIINGSWGSRNPADEVFRPDLQALRAAGIVPVFAAGNEGPQTSSLRSPASYPEAIAVGATDSVDAVADFSSRGPSPWGEIKPEVMAPGVQIRSSLPGGSYGTKGGTSMAAPHVSGVVALMLQADPSLTVNEVEAILTSTALSLGGQVPNNSSGWGRVDAYRAASSAMRAGVVTGRVLREPDLQPLPHSQVRVSNDLGEPWATAPVDGSGTYSVNLPAGRYSLTFEAFGYLPRTLAGVTLQSGVTTTVDVILPPAPTGVLWGQLTLAETGGPLAVEVAIPGTPAHTTSDPQTGHYSLPLPAGIHTVEIAQNGYRRYTVPAVEIVVDQATRLDAALTPAPTLLLLDSGPWYYGSQLEYFEQALKDLSYVYDVWQIRDLATDLPALPDLAPYQITIWSSPEDAPGLIGAGDIISGYLSSGGRLFLTGQDIGYWDDGLSGYTWHEYYRRFLKAKAVADDAGRDDVVGAVDDILQGLSLPLNGPDSAGNQKYPDAIKLLDTLDAASIARYGSSVDAGLRVSPCHSYRVIYLASGLEGLGDRTSRAEVMDRVLAWLSTPPPAAGLGIYPPSQKEVWQGGPAITYTMELLNTGQDTDHFVFEPSPSAWPISVWDRSFSQPITQSAMLSACETQTLYLTVSFPEDISWNVTDTVTLTARSTNDPSRTAQAVFQSKAPAPILLVDDHRWYDTSPAYQSGLETNHLFYDLWSTEQPAYPKGISPSLQRLEGYPVVIWFTAYDWFRTLTTDDEQTLAAYLEGGGRLLLSSQDYLDTSGFTDFARDYFGVVGYTEGLTTTQVTGAVSSPFGQAQGPCELLYPFPNWSDALVAGPATDFVFWGQHGQPAALAKQQAPWKTAFFAFPLEALSPQEMATVLGDAVEWLSPLGDSSFVVEPPVASPGEEVRYTLYMRNTGPRPLTSVSLSNTVPLSATYVAGSLSGPASYDPTTRRITWGGALSAGEKVTISYRVQLDPSLPVGSRISNTAHMSEESALVAERAATIGVDTPDLEGSSKMVSARLTAPGQRLTYTVTLRNSSLRAAEARLTDLIPLNTTHLPGSGWASSGQLTSTAALLAWAGSISAGQVVTISFPVQIDPLLPRRYIHNRAILDDGWGQIHALEADSLVRTQIHLPVIQR